MPEAVEHIRRMRGGAQAHLLRCREPGGESYYVVKFQNNPQHPRILVNELLGTRLAEALGLPTPGVAVIDVAQELIDGTEDLAVHCGSGHARCRAGKQFGSRYPGHPAQLTVHDFLPDEQLRAVHNLGDFLGMLVFDKWTCNTNGRQAIFFRDGGLGYVTQMIDQGFCFHAGEWSFPDAPLRGLYMRALVYDAVRGMDSFAPWLARLQSRIAEDALDRFVREVPGEWYDHDEPSLYRLCEQLLARRRRVPDLLLEARKSYRQPFPNWT